MTKQIETYIEEHLSGNMKQTAMDFVKHLRKNDLTFYRDTCGCWKDKIYYPDEPNNLWTVWSDDSSTYEDASVSDEIKNVGWQYVDHCGNCGSCGGGKEKVIFGRRFPSVCGCTFRIDNAKQEDLTFLKTMVDLRIKEKGYK